MVRTKKEFLLSNAKESIGSLETYNQAEAILCRTNV